MCSRSPAFFPKEDLYNINFLDLTNTPFIYHHISMYAEIFIAFKKLSNLLIDLVTKALNTMFTNKVQLVVYLNGQMNE